MNAPHETTWSLTPRPDPGAPLRLFCFPWAGAGAAAYRTWPAALAGIAEVRLVLLPGRDSRRHEPPLTDLAALAARAAQGLAGQLDPPFALFGHSMGALVAFETAHALRRLGAPAPARLLVSGRRAPQLPRRPGPLLHGLPDGALVDELRRRYDDIPRLLLEEPELMALFLPVLRADFHALETYGGPPQERLGCAVSAYGGRSDPTAAEAELAAWRETTRGPFDHELLPGGHFYLQTAEAPLIAALRRRLGGESEEGPRRCQ